MTDHTDLRAALIETFAQHPHANPETLAELAIAVIALWIADEPTEEP